MIISPIFYMGNKKKLIQKGLIDLFPKNIGTFVDLFSGSGIVSMNIIANNYFVNDINTYIYDFYKMFSNETSDYIISRILSNIKKFGMLRVGVKQNSTEAEVYKEKYIKMREYANKGDIIDLYSCMFYAFSQQMRFNSKGCFNMPFGNGAFTESNEEYIKNGCNFFSKENVAITNNDFRVLKPCNLSENDFVYLDPPYFNTTATYNENGGWTENDENDLYKLCEELNNCNIKFAMSNVFSNKGITNEKLIEWCKKNNWSVHYFDNFTYSACGKGNGKTVEVLIMNY